MKSVPQTRVILRCKYRCLPLRPTDPRFCYTSFQGTNFFDLDVNIRGSFLAIGLGGAVALTLFGIFYAASHQDLAVYFLIGLLAVGTATAVMLWTARLERKAARSDELDHLKSEFVSRVSHELRTPLTTIKALTRLLLRGDVNEQKRREYLETISIECDRQIDLVLNILDLSRMEGGVFRLSLERVEVADVVLSCVKSEMNAAERRSHVLQIKPFGNIPPICAEPKALRRVLSNLIENSIKYTPDGGLITISANEEGGHAAINVTDNGRGIPAEDLPVLFDKFHRGRRADHSAAMSEATTDAEFLEDADVSGVGLGLYLARDVIGRMGGRISVETEVGQGSTFTLHLPVWNATECGERAKTENENG